MNWLAQLGMACVVHFATCCVAPCFSGEPKAPDIALVDAKTGSNLAEDIRALGASVRAVGESVLVEIGPQSKHSEILSKLAGAKGLGRLYVSWETEVPSDVIERELSQIVVLTDLRNLDMNGPILSKMLAPIKRLTKLESISLSSLDFDDDVFDYVAALPQLRKIRIRGERVTGAKAGLLKDAAHLESLSLSRSGVNDEGLAEIAKLKQLSGELNLHRCPITDAGLVHLNSLTKLKRLDIAGTKVGGKAKKFPLSELKSLTDLWVYETAVDGNWFQGISELPLVFTLSAWNTRLDDDAAREIGKLKNLSRLSISKTAITDDGLREIAKLQSLHTLSIEQCKTTDAGLVPLQDLEKLTYLRLAGAGHGDALAAPVSKMPALEHLEVRATRLTDKGFKKLCETTKLRRIDISYTAVSEVGLMHILSAKQLRAVTIDGISVDPATLDKIKQRIPGMQFRFSKPPGA